MKYDTWLHHGDRAGKDALLPTQIYCHFCNAKLTSNRLFCRFCARPQVRVERKEDGNK
jgi:hypothetical protein